MGAESEFSGGRFNNCANRAYYACFQGAIAALQRAGIRPQGAQWSHAYVPAQFEGVLINTRKLYSAELRGVLALTHGLRQKADYNEQPVSQAEANRVLRRARTFVQTIANRRGATT